MFTDQYLQSCRTVTVRGSEFFMLLKKFFFFYIFRSAGGSSGHQYLTLNQSSLWRSLFLSLSQSSVCVCSSKSPIQWPDPCDRSKSLCFLSVQLLQDLMSVQALASDLQEVRVVMNE